MKVKISLNEKEIQEAIAKFIFDKFGVGVRAEDLYIETKSKQNYRSEWEKAAIRVDCEIETKMPET